MMSIVKGAPSSDRKAALSSVEGLTVSSVPTNRSYYVVTVKTRVAASSPAEAAAHVQELLLRDES